MQTIVLLFSIAVALFCIAALSEHGKAEDAYRRRKESLREAKKHVRDEVLNKPLKERIITPFLQGIARFTANEKFKSDTRSTSYLQRERLLRQAGLSITPEGYRYFRILLTGSLVGMTIGIILSKVYLAALWTLIGILLSALLQIIM